ncbi:hypothetical protein HI914_01061 [Erysiphe necator]|nr:hypothetical protein HI914_01061 [Erysiphe necator]
MKLVSNNFKNGGAWTIDGSKLATNEFVLDQRSAVERNTTIVLQKTTIRTLKTTAANPDIEMEQNKGIATKKTLRDKKIWHKFIKMTGKNRNYGILIW